MHNTLAVLNSNWTAVRVIATLIVKVCYDDGEFEVPGVADLPRDVAANVLGLLANKQKNNFLVLHSFAKLNLYRLGEAGITGDVEVMSIVEAKVDIFIVAPRSE